MNIWSLAFCVCMGQINTPFVAPDNILGFEDSLTYEAGPGGGSAYENEALEEKKMRLSFFYQESLADDVDVLAFTLAVVALDIAELARAQGDINLYHSSLVGAYNLENVLIRGMAKSSGMSLISVIRGPRISIAAMIDQLSVVDFTTDFVPGLNIVKDLIIISSGTNPVTGETVTDFEKSLRVGSLILPGLAGAAMKKYTAIGAALQKPAAWSPVQTTLNRLTAVFKNAEQSATTNLLSHLALPCLP